MQPPAMIRAVAFFDGQNLFHSAKAAFGYTYPNYDPLALATKICALRGWHLEQTRFYTGVPDPADNDSGAISGSQSAPRWDAKALISTRVLFDTGTGKSNYRMEAHSPSWTVTKRVSMFGLHWMSFALLTKIATTWLCSSVATKTSPRLLRSFG